MYSNALGSIRDSVTRMSTREPAAIKAKFDESSNFLKWGIEIWDYFVANPDKRETIYKGWTFTKITDNIEQLHDNLKGWIKQYPLLQVSPALSRNLNKAYEIFTRKHTWTAETDPAGSDIKPNVPTLDFEAEEMNIAGIAGLSPKMMMMAGGAIAAVLVGVLIFKRK